MSVLGMLFPRLKATDLGLLGGSAAILLVKD